MIKLITSIAAVLAFSSMAWAIDVDTKSNGNSGLGGADATADVETKTGDATFGKEGAGLSVTVEDGEVTSVTVGGSSAANPN